MSIKLRGTAWPTIQFLFLLATIALLLYWGAERSGYHWQWYRMPRFFWTVDESGWHAGPLLQGLGVTFKIVSLSMLLAPLCGLLAALGRLSSSRVARLLARIYLETIRNTPLLIQLFVLYFVIAPVFDLGRFTSAVLALSLFEGAYASEIIRAGIVSVAQGQWEAAYSLGLSLRDTYRDVVLPQAMRRIVPPLTSQAISLVKDSALVSTIAIYDLTMQGQMIVAETFLTFETWLTVATIYLAVTVSLSLLVRLLEERFAVPG
ncbi:MAG: polar amino acid ABC transporter permease [Desulfuromonas sp.]|nr:MAG: polar amino acid ABC transporter permease [Desulfuromonas sp.]